MRHLQQPLSISAGAPIASSTHKSPPNVSVTSRPNSPKIFFRDLRRQHERTSTCAPFMAALHITKSKLSSKPSRARFVLRSHAINAFAAFFPARKAFYEDHAHRLRSG